MVELKPDFGKNFKFCNDIGISMTDAAKEEYVFEEELVAAQTNLGDG